MGDSIYLTPDNKLELFLSPRTAQSVVLEVSLDMDSWETIKTISTSSLQTNGDTGRKIYYRYTPLGGYVGKVFYLRLVDVLRGVRVETSTIRVVCPYSSMGDVHSFSCTVPAGASILDSLNLIFPSSEKIQVQNTGETDILASFSTGSSEFAVASGTTEIREGIFNRITLRAIAASSNANIQISTRHTFG